MEKEVKCSNCQSDLIIIENKMFYPDVEHEVNLNCSVCNNIVAKEMTDGWFFIQTKKQFFIDLKNNSKKQGLIFPMP